MCISLITVYGYYISYTIQGQCCSIHQGDIRMTTDNRNNSAYGLVITSLMICLVLLGTVLFRIPVPMTQGYVHLGDAMIYISVILLGKKQGAVAAALGSSLGDILGGYAFWAPWTFFIKLAMAFIAGSLIEAASCGAHYHQSSGSHVFRLASAMGAGGIVMCSGYLAAERIMYGSWGLAALGLPWNIGQFVTGIAVAIAAKPLCDRLRLYQ